MATVQLSDVVIPEIYADYQAENTPEKTAFYQSGIVVSNELLNQKAGSGGRILDIPFWKDLDSADEPNVSTDNPATLAVPSKITTGMQVARMAYVNNGWSAADLAGEIAGSNPMQRIASRTGTYWVRQWQRRLIQSSLGIMADNVANDSSDMVSDVSIATGDTAAAANLFSRAAFTTAAFTLGDAFQSTSAVAVHSVVYKRMVDGDDIDFIRDSQGVLVMPTFMGRQVIIDDGMPVVAAATNGYIYTSILYGAGAFGYGDGSPYTPVEVEREASQGNGAGIETLWERKSWLLHPFGYAFASGTVASESATNAELALAANWNRVVERKNSPIAFLRTNG